VPGGSRVSDPTTYQVLPLPSSPLTCSRRASSAIFLQSVIGLPVAGMLPYGIAKPILYPDAIRTIPSIGVVFVELSRSRIPHYD
jgi:hypothetical protein